MPELGDVAQARKSVLPWRGPNPVQEVAAWVVILAGAGALFLGPWYLGETHRLSGAVRALGGGLLFLSWTLQSPGTRHWLGGVGAALIALGELYFMVAR